MAEGELQRLLAVWDAEAGRTVALLRSLPEDQYDFRPDPAGRSLGELAWHLAEGDAYMSAGVEAGGFDLSQKPPGLARPRTVPELAPGYERIHADAMARLRKLRPEDLDREIKFADGSIRKIGDILWEGLLLHLVHHRGQLVMLCRQSGGSPPSPYGPNREETAAMRAAAAAR
jgi:uncharacterized damage-inducible protein DinB